MSDYKLSNALLWSFCGSIVSSGFMGALLASKNKYAGIPAVLLYVNTYLFIKKTEKRVILG